MSPYWLQAEVPKCVDCCTMDPGSLTFLTKSDPHFREGMDLEESRARDDDENLMPGIFVPPY